MAAASECSAVLALLGLHSAPYVSKYPVGLHCWPWALCPADSQPLAFCIFCQLSECF